MSQALRKSDALPTITVVRVPTLDGAGELVARVPLVFHPIALPDGEYFKAEYEPIDISAIEEDFDQLEPAILDQIAFMWETYALKPDNELAYRGITLKENMLKHFAAQ